MIFLPLLILAAIVYGFIWVCGTFIGYVAYKKSEKYKKEFRETPDLLTRGRPVGEKDLEGWDGASVLEIDEDW